MQRLDVHARGTSRRTAGRSRASWLRSAISAGAGARVLDLHRDVAGRRARPPGAPGRCWPRRPGRRRTRGTARASPPPSCWASTACTVRAGIGGAASCSLASASRYGAGDLLGHRGLEDRQRLAELHRPALELAEHGEQLLGGPLLQLGVDLLGRPARQLLAHARGSRGLRRPAGAQPAVPSGHRPPWDVPSGVTHLAIVTCPGRRRPGRPRRTRSRGAVATAAAAGGRRGDAPRGSRPGPPDRRRRPGGRAPATAAVRAVSRQVIVAPLGTGSAAASCAASRGQAGSSSPPPGLGAPKAAGRPG